MAGGGGGGGGGGIPARASRIPARASRVLNHLRGNTFVVKSTALLSALIRSCVCMRCVWVGGVGVYVRESE